MSQKQHDLDCRGMRCPAPVIALGRTLSGIEIGDVVALAATDVAARTDVPAFCRMRDQEYVGEVTAEDGVAVYLVRRRT